MLDAVTALGVALKREVPKGAKFTAWVQSDEGFIEFIDALWAILPGVFTWNYAAGTIDDLTHWTWSPTAHEVRDWYRDRGGKHWDAIEGARHKRITQSINKWAA